MAQNQTEEIPFGLRVIELIFVAIFTTELVLRLFVHRFSFFYMSGCAWNWFDFFVVLLMLMEELTDALQKVVDLQAMRVLRILRLIRVVRMVRIIHLIGELRTLATSIASSLKSLAWTVVMLMLLMFIVGVTLTQIVSDFRISNSEPGDHHGELGSKFGSVFISMLTLYQAFTGGIDWNDATEPLHEYVSVWLSPCFALYIAFVVLAMMNVVTGVFVESALKSAKEDRDSTIITNMRDLFGKDGNDQMTREDFLAMSMSAEMCDYFETLDVDPSEAELVFRLLDADGDGTVDQTEFMNGCLKLTGPAKSLDISILRTELRSMSLALMYHLRHLEHMALGQTGETFEGTGEEQISDAFLK